MKKLINTLTAITILLSPITSIISCGTKKDSEKEVDNNYSSLTDVQKQMYNGAEILSKLIIASRHENLNYNINEILSMYLAPTPTALKIPTSYTYNKKQVDFSNSIEMFKSILMPSISKIDIDKNAGVYASYIMGMYEDGFYKDYLKNGYFEDSFNKEGGKGFNKSSNNEMGILAGLDKELKLSNEESRKDLSWAIQDTGALTNYLLNKGYDGSYPGDSNGTKGPTGHPTDERGGTNSAGYLFYNSIISNGKGSYNAFQKEVTVQDKLDQGNNFKKGDFINKIYSSEINGINFNKIGSMFSNTAGYLNISGYINSFVTLLKNVSESDFGSEYLLNAANYFTPMVVNVKDETNSRVQLVGLSLLYNAQEAVYNIMNKTTRDGKSLKSFLKDNGFSEDLLSKKYEDIKSIGINEVLTDVGKIDKIKVTRIYSNNNSLESLKNTSLFLKELKTFQTNLKTEKLKKEFSQTFYTDVTSPFYQAYNLIIKPPIAGIGGIGESGWKELMSEDGSGAVNLLNLLSIAYDNLSNEDTKELLETVTSKFNNVSINSLSRSQKLGLINDLGYDSLNKKYKENSYMGIFYNIIKNENIAGVSELNSLLDFLNDSVNREMKTLHENALQYIYDDNYWKLNNINLNSTAPNEIGGEMEFTLSYTGNGDADSNADQQTQKVNVPDNFNPYQTLIKHQEDYANSDSLKNSIDKNKKSGIILGKEQLNMSDEDILNYDGKGENYKAVNHKYTIKWKNISDDIDNPYWIIVDMKSFNSDGKEFYNIY
ncbi:hypothetical protein SLITO_v1c03880 [Spiroplasma litorale]|uniref:Lipoprotein n=1 Tax=Spiroplasma litorale TaxID=216942 RepID=A0A0K1W1I2_9MOLU|nr:hypothetical protein [Spiroplasma litorale]AKX34041.1 hypothetical protein SLITO_v1c03880 [Spiroplasma litorale]